MLTSMSDYLKEKHLKQYYCSLFVKQAILFM